MLKALRSGLTVSIPRASPTAEYVNLPSCTLSPLNRCGLSEQAFIQPLSAREIIKGSVAFRELKLKCAQLLPACLQRSNALCHLFHKLDQHVSWREMFQNNHLDQLQHQLKRCQVVG